MPRVMIEGFSTVSAESTALELKALLVKGYLKQG
jgi:hypothetical protein